MRVRVRVRVRVRFRVRVRVTKRSTFCAKASDVAPSWDEGVCSARRTARSASGVA